MKRINPQTNRPFKRGDQRNDGFLFNGYQTAKKRKDGTFYETWVKPETLERLHEKQKSNNKKQRMSVEGIVKAQNWNTRYRAKRDNIPFDLTLDYLLSILPTHCPVFDVEFVWFNKQGKIHQFSPSLDRIIPENGYIKGNVQWISNLANMMKQNASTEQLKQFASWVLNQS